MEYESNMIEEYMTKDRDKDNQRWRLLDVKILDKIIFYETNCMKFF